MKNKKLLTLVWLLFLASCSSSNTNQTDVSSTTDLTDNVLESTGTTDSWSSESLNTNIKKTEVAKWNWVWSRKYRWWDTNTKAS